MFEWPTIVSTVIATLTAGGWLTSSRIRKREEENHKAELEKSRADTISALRDSETKYVKETLEIYTTQVVQPLRDQIRLYREEQIRKDEAIKQAYKCSLYPNCIIIDALRHKKKNIPADATRSDDVE